ncbi:1243_t:CDS:2 [Dentiscutata erythropus]|uniref:1243_t:CDS:1 n=1 Tax=Dentiscutata erythropus TaxID=1348616 RepID=A0A9N9IQF5_9GLOM|nr:1243_t:CDS:2 [Dentiscutata erythropus]
MDPNSNNDDKDSNTNAVDNVQRDISSSDAKDFYPQMVEDQSIQHLISWAISGDVFSVSNPTEFSKTVLPQYFKHNNWQSFVRQLNMYGFHKVNDMFHANPTSESQAWEFKHPEFRRGQLAALQNIKRKSAKHQSSNHIKGNLSSAGTGQNPSSDITAADAVRDEKIEYLTNQMAEIMEKMRQMSENYSLLYAETVSCRMQQSKHEKVITDIANFLSSILREVDCIQAEVVKFGQGDIPPSPHPPMMQFPHYYREGMHPTRSMSTPQPMIGVESTSSSHHSSSFLGSQSLHRSPTKIPSSSPLSMLPELPFTHHFQPSNNYLRHRSPEPITNTSPSGESRTSSIDAYRSSSIQSTSSNSSQTTPKYPQPSRSSTHPSHMQSASTPSRRASQPTTSLSFGSDSNLLNPSETNRYKDNNTTTIPKSQSATSSSPTPYSKSEDPIVTNPTTTQQRPPPLPDPPDNEIEHNKRHKKN